MLSVLLWILEWHSAAKHSTWYTDTGWWMSVTANPVACSTQYLHQLRLMLPSLSSPAAMVYEPSMKPYFVLSTFTERLTWNTTWISPYTAQTASFKAMIFKCFFVQGLVVTPVTDLSHCRHFLNAILWFIILNIFKWPVDFLGRNILYWNRKIRWDISKSVSFYLGYIL